MTMVMDGLVVIPARPEQVWAGLNDPDMLARCIPGCQTLEKIGPDGFAATVKVKVGPISATFRGKVCLSDLNPPHGYHISGSGEGGIAGFAKGGAEVRLAALADAQTELSYTVSAEIGGKIAQLGSRLIDGVAKNLANQFFEQFSRVMSVQAEAGLACVEGPSA